MRVSKELALEMFGGEWPEADGFYWGNVSHFDLEEGFLVPYDGQDVAPGPDFQVILTKAQAIGEEKQPEGGVMKEHGPCAIISAYTGFVLGDFAETHRYIEHLMGRPVFTHEMPDLKEKIQERAKKDFVALEPLVKAAPGLKTENERLRKFVEGYALAADACSSDIGISCSECQQTEDCINRAAAKVLAQASREGE